ncbi:hypothetical protein CEE37_03215 [candidate division LCP-89 bacterium B3_LCP]|uniref:Glycosyltransferase RgtA/B/C/D-like domain-containing protein n=1 Tax=candidate division LCP-89 bacterium B3_LCP TaxID=2012998 RepID=A0A532V370_UNCL8|nr:MAG: hypothetical protein CEE37_03215 [candidate division LCP-89 bacterium B3_LCP]
MQINQKSPTAELHPYEDSGYKNEFLIVLSLFLLGLLLRSIRLFDLDVWLDEAVLLLQLDGSYTDIWNFCKNDNFPPLYPWVIKAWSSIFPGENSLRFLSAFLGALTPPAAYFLGKELLNKKLGLALGIACCLSAGLLYFSQMIRMYAIFPFFGCISLIGLFRGLKTNHWKYWILMSLANLLGYYTFLYMIFLIAVEFVVILWHAKRNLRLMVKPILAHLPTALLILVWLIPMLSRYQAVQEGFWLEPFSLRDLGKLWFFFGSGSDIGNRYLIAGIINLPFLFGFVAAFKAMRGNVNVQLSLFIVISVVLSALVISLLGQSIFFKRYFIFLLPLYLGIVIFGWLSVKNKMLANVGLFLTFFALIFTTGYYYVYYYEVHSVYTFTLPRGPEEKCDGHGISKAADFLRKRIDNKEVIIHYSRPLTRSFIYFPMLYYHQRQLPEYIMSAVPIPNYFGGQYLKNSERIGSLHELDELPKGIWVVSTDSVVSYFDRDLVLKSGKQNIWLQREDLLKELKQNDYIHTETTRFGRVSTRYYRRELNTSTTKG